MATDEKFLQVLSHSPKTSENDVCLKPEIKVEFSSDLDKDTVDEKSVKLLTQKDEAIEINIYCKGKTLKIKPLDYLDTARKYKVLIKGTLKSPEIHPVIIDILGKPLPRDYEFFFVTMENIPLDPPEIKKPTHQTIARDLEIVWDEVDDAENYNVEICKNKLFNNIEYSTTTRSTSLEPYGIDENQEYFIRVNSNNRLNNSEWSDIVAFYYEPKKYENIEEDVSDEDDLFEEKKTRIEFLNLDKFNAETDINSIDIKIEEKITEDDLKYLDIKLKGKSIRSMPHIESHGVVDGEAYIKESTETYTIISYII